MSVSRVLGIVLFLLLSSGLMGQAPIINNVTPLTTYPQNKILITGSGFSDTEANLQVWLDHVKGTITNSTEFSIEVVVPYQARLSNIEVINLTTRLSAKTLNKFIPFFSGSTFDETKFQATVANTTSFSTGTEEAFDVCSCDLDGDGKPDLASTRNTSISTGITILRNTSTPGALSYVSSNIALGAQSLNLACGDVNMDGKPDLVVVRGGASRNQVYVLRNTSTVGAISFAAPTNLFIDAGQLAFRVSIRDLNLDGKPEVIVSNSFTPVPATNTNIIYFFSNTSAGGTLSFNPTPSKLTVTGPNSTYGMDVQDLNGDSKPEIILNQFTSNDIYIIKNQSSVGELSFSTATDKITLTGTLNHLTTADFNKDGKLDIAVTSSFDDFLYVILNQSTGSTIAFGTPIQLTTGDNPWGVDATDIDGDQDVDIIVGNRGPTETNISVFKNDGGTSPTFTKVNVAAGKRSRNIRVGDYDGDGKPDIAFTADVGNAIDILRNRNCFVPQITNTSPLTVCAGQTITLTAIKSPNVTYAWRESTNPAFKTGLYDGSTGTEGFTTADITTPGSYIITATSEGGSCISQSSTFNVGSGLGTVPANPTINPVATVCTGQTLNLTTPSVAGATYEWKGPNSFTSSVQNPSITNVTSSNAGIYTLQLANGTCKSNVASVTVDIANMSNFFVSSSVASNTVCTGSTLNLIVNTATNHTYQWIKDGADVAGQTNSSFTVGDQGVYKVRVTNTNLSCSVETSTTTVNVFTAPVSTFTANPASTCINQTITLTNQSTVDSRATTVYTWDFGDATTSSSQNTTKVFTTAGTRNIQLTVSYTGVNGCSNSSTKSVVVSTAQTPAITASANPICAGDPTALSVSGTFATYAWTGPATGNSATLNITQPGTYILNTTEANGCAGTAQIVIGTKNGVTITVTADSKPVADASDLLVIAGIPVQLTASGADTYAWSPPEDLDNPLLANPKLSATKEASYQVKGSRNGFCDGVVSFNVKFDPAGDNFVPPNAFSPNGDGINDLWVIPGIQNFSECTLSIFNKQGGKVFEQRGYTNNWDGIFEGKELPSGTYYYVLTCPDKQPSTGHVLLAR